MKRLEADVLVVGAGSAGLSAALTASSGGANVIIMEKLPMPGGYSLMAEGLFAAESDFQRREYIGATKEEAFKNHMNASHWRPNGRLIRAFIDKSADTIDWLMNLGVNFAKVTTMWPGGPRTWHLMEGGGKKLIDTFCAKLLEKKVRLLLGTPAKQVIFDENNNISAVIGMDKDGNEVRVDTRVVIIAGGGYANSNEMLSEYSDMKFKPQSIIPMQQTGDHIKMAWEAGAERDSLGVYMAIPSIVGESPTSHLWAAAVQPFLWVNQLGERFCDESISFIFPIAANALAQQKDGVMYTIFDENSKRLLIEEGVDVCLGIFIPVATRLVNLDNAIEKGVSEGKAFVANSLNELAAKIGVSKDNLNNSVEEMNQAFEDNHDAIFAKDKRYLKPIKKGKYYALKCIYQVFTTLGGIKINYKTEVLNTNSEVIPGLYAIGNCAGGVYAWHYEVFTAGGALGFAVNSGRIAGENCLEFLNKKVD
ncbi:MAG TPA: FAD-dependent oxidoreductase [Candidatus Kapabacteria bacterium]|nr:FAD-dependent oxidoreductase [Candidatus Kapabacteria bacterium]